MSGIGDREKHRQRHHHERCCRHLAPAQALVVEPGAERQREHDAQDEQGLNDGELAESQRRGLCDEADDVESDPGQPHGADRHPEKQAGAVR
jgi:hypothetical protein